MKNEDKASIEACRILRKNFISADHPNLKAYDDAYIIRNYPDEWGFFMDGWKFAQK